jgi:chemotaxis protein CheZ
MIDPDKAPILLDDAKKLVDSSETGNNRAATEILEAITLANSEELFVEKGRLTRRRHDSLNRFQLEPPIAILATDEIPNTPNRLRYLKKATEKSANMTRDAVDQSKPVADKLHSIISQISPELKKRMSRQWQLAECNIVCHQLDPWLQESSKETARRSDLLTKVLMAQGYQNPSVQVIPRAIGLGKDVENTLLDKLTVFAAADSTFCVAKNNNSTHKSRKESDNLKADCPIMNAYFRKNVVLGQDDLVSSLGF